MFITDDKTKTIVINNVPPICKTVQLVEVTEECIDKIADAVAKRLLNTEDEDTEENWYDWRDKE